MSAPVLRPGILDIAAYVPGKANLAGKKRVIKLSSNEGALGPSPEAVKAYRRAIKTMDRYPDGSCAALREAIGRRHGLDPARIICGAGSDEVLANLARAYAGPGDEILHTRHGFNMYPIFAHAVGRDAGVDAGEAFDRRCRRAARACHAEDAHGLPRQPEQPDRHLCCRRRAEAAARRACATTSCW